MKIDKDFLGRGWGFPPEFNKAQKEVVMTTGNDDIKNSLIILLSTRLRERVMLPKYGCNLEELLFKPLDLTLETEIKDIITKAILYHEPRIDILEIKLDSTDELEGEVLIQIEYQIRNTNTRSNLVYPFYKGEATEI